MMTTTLSHTSDQVLPASLVSKVDLKVRLCLKAFPVSTKGNNTLNSNFGGIRTTFWHLSKSIPQSPFLKMVLCGIDIFCKILTIDFTFDVGKCLNPFLSQLKMLGVQELTFFHIEKIDQFYQSFTNASSSRIVSNR